MELADFLKLGFNRNEARVYLSLIKFGKADAHQIISDTKFHKNIVYDNLEKLIDKGLVTFIIEECRKVFQVAPSHMLIQFIEEQEKEIEGKKRLASTIAKEISKHVPKIPFKQEARIFRGVRGIKTFYEETLKGRDFVAFGAPQASVDIMGELFWQNYDAKRRERKILARLIFNPSLKEYGSTIKNSFTDIRYFDQYFEPMTETHVQDDKVAIIVWSEEPVLFLIQDKFVTDSYLRFFEEMWKKARK